MGEISEKRETTVLKQALFFLSEIHGALDEEFERYLRIARSSLLGEFFHLDAQGRVAERHLHRIAELCRRLASSFGNWESVQQQELLLEVMEILSLLSLCIGMQSNGDTSSKHSCRALSRVMSCSDRARACIAVLEQVRSCCYEISVFSELESESSFSSVRVSQGK